MAGLKENLGAPGRTQEWRVDPLSNILVQNSRYFVGPGASTNTASVRVGSPIVIVVDEDNEAADPVSNTVYTVPAGYKFTVLQMNVIARSAESGGTVQLLNGSDAICTAVVCAVDGVAGWMVAGIDDTKYEVAAGGTLVTTGTAGGSGNCPAYRAIIFGLLEAV